MSRHVAWLVVVTLSLLAGAEGARAQRHRARVGVVLVPNGLYVGGGVVGAMILWQSGGPELHPSVISVTAMRSTKR